MVEQGAGERCARAIDWLIAAWVLTMAVLFAVPPVVATLWSGVGHIVGVAVEELQVAARGVYLVVVSICLVSVALNLARRLSKP